ncbi:MAG: DUF6452 family protein [Fulvivirga sp.]|nr:DUF6452 family protein [Fulvivirga sp.]
MKGSDIVLILVIILAIAACDDPDCVSDFSDEIHVSFFKMEENQRDTIFINSITATNDSSVVGSALLTSVVLPADPNRSEATFIFNTREYGIDTLTLSYTNGARLISEDCGVEQFFSDLEVARSDFDSTSVINQVLVEQINEDIRIYNN